MILTDISEPIERPDGSREAIGTAIIDGKQRPIYTAQPVPDTGLYIVSYLRGHDNNGPVYKTIRIEDNWYYQYG